VTTPDLGTLFATFASSAFRLETLPQYRMDTEAEPLRLFLEGKPEPEWRKDRPWLTTVRNAVARGARMQRVRIVQMPLTDYQRYQFSWGYVANEQAGEELSILDHRPPGMLHEDFWLFDDELAIVLEYDEEGRFLRPTFAEDAEPYRACRDLVSVSAVPFGAYRLRSQVEQR
jgi:hypothetical protein